MRTKLPILAAFACLPTFCAANSWVQPWTQTHASTNKAHRCKVVVNEKNAFSGPATAVVSAADKEGKEKELWRGKMANQPHRVFVSDSKPSVVTVDTYGNLGFKHCLVVYGQDGKVLADYKLEDLLTEAELAKVPQSVSSRHWAGKAKFAFTDDGKQFEIKLESGRTIRADLGTGKLVK